MPSLAPRYFNTAGPCQPDRHYMLPTGRRLPALRRLIEEERYFVVHAARQTGKTTAMRALAEELRAEGTVALHVSLEASRRTPRVEDVEPRWINALADEAQWMLPPDAQIPEAALAKALAQKPGTALASLLGDWSLAQHPRPLVLMLDEVDTIEGAAMVNFLAQLRSGFHRRPRAFPSSVILVGMRDLKDYLVEAKGGMPPNPGSPFNIKSHSLTLRNFTQDEMVELYAQHTADTGQPFTNDAVERAFYWSQGQPFLVNALAYQITREDPIPPPTPITGADIDRAKDALILTRTTHLDNLNHRLHEPRVAQIVRPILLGEQEMDLQASPDDLDYCFDLGLLRRGPLGLEPANPLYREVLARTLASPVQDRLPRPWWRWQREDGGLDFPTLVDAFFGWWREHGDLLVDSEDAGWKEAAAHLALMGFLQRVVNGGGSVTREYASGLGALDLLVCWRDERYAVEVKRVRPRHETLEDVRERGVAQLQRYLDRLGLAEGWLLVFDQRKGRGWDERLWREERTVDGRTLHLRGG